jgi:hypothetical protein
LMDGTDGTSFLPAGQCRDFRLRMPKQNFDEFNGSLTGRSKNCYCRHVLQ